MSTHLLLLYITQLGMYVNTHTTSLHNTAWSMCHTHTTSLHNTAWSVCQHTYYFSTQHSLISVSTHILLLYTTQLDQCVTHILLLYTTQLDMCVNRHTTSLHNTAWSVCHTHTTSLHNTAWSVCQQTHSGWLDTCTHLHMPIVSNACKWRHTFTHPNICYAWAYLCVCWSV